MTTGRILIAAERQRQINAEGWTVVEAKRVSTKS